MSVRTTRHPRPQNLHFSNVPTTTSRILSPGPRPASMRKADSRTVPLGRGGRRRKEANHRVKPSSARPCPHTLAPLYVCISPDPAWRWQHLPDAGRPATILEHSGRMHRATPGDDFGQTRTGTVRTTLNCPSAGEVRLPHQVAVTGTKDDCRS